jgi:hypothetical protein
MEWPRERDNPECRGQSPFLDYIAGANLDPKNSIQHGVKLIRREHRRAGPLHLSGSRRARSLATRRRARRSGHDPQLIPRRMLRTSPSDWKRCQRVGVTRAAAKDPELARGSGPHERRMHESSLEDADRVRWSVSRPTPER